MIESRLLHLSLEVRDLDAALTFYTETFGFVLKLHAPGITREIAEMLGTRGLRCDLAQLEHPASSVRLELIRFFPSNSEDPPPRSHIAFSVPDLAVAEVEVLARGAFRLGSTIEFEEAIAAYYREPGGSMFELEQIKPIA